METKLRTVTGEFQIDIATVSDLPAILDCTSFDNRVPYNEASFWKWRYFENPVADVKVYVARTVDRKIAAMQSVSAYTIHVDGQKHIAHCLTGAVTAPHFRRRGLFRLLVQTIVQDLSGQGASILFTFPNKLSVQGFRRFPGWEKHELLSLYMRPLMSLHGGGPRSYDREVTVRPRNELSDLEIVRQQNVRIGGDELLEKSNPHLSFIDRSKKYLTWRYYGGTANEYEMFHAVCGSVNEGYVVLTPRQIKGFTVGLVVDLVARSNAVANELLRAAVTHSQRKGYRMLAFLVGRANPYRRALNMSRFVKWPNALLPRRFHVYTYAFDQDGRKAELIVRNMNWYLTWGDTDVT